MGKYNFSHAEDDEKSFIPYILCAIANEQAESNRLKRLELKILGGNMDIPNTMKQISEDMA